MMQKVLEKIRYYEEEFKKYGDESYCSTIALSGINDTFPEFIEAILINALKKKNVFTYIPFYFYKIAIIENIGDSFIIKIGEDINGKFIENDKENPFYFIAQFKNNNCYLETNLYNINCINFNCPDWLMAMLISYIKQYNLFNNCAYYLGPKLQEEYIQNRILTEKGEKALEEYKNNKKDYEFRNISFFDFENPDYKWLGCSSKIEARLLLSEMYPIAFQKYLIMKD